MFKEGQLVTAKEFNRYSVTDRGKPLEVVNCNHNRMRVKCLWTSDEDKESFIKTLSKWFEN